MNTRRYLKVGSILTVVLLLAGIVVGGVQARDSEPPARVLISFRTLPGPAERALVEHVGGSVRYTYHLVPAIAATVPGAAIAGLQANPNVMRVEPVTRARAVDTELDNSWGVKRIGSGAVHTDGNKGTDMSIAIIDSGVDYTHPDLDNNYVAGYDFVENDGDPMDVYGHGTHVAGTACAEDNDNGTTDPTLGVVGVAPACALYSLRVLDDDGYGYSDDIIAAMEWAVENEIQVTNLSLGWDRDPGAAVKDAFDNAWAAGLVTVAAAGNSGNPAGRGNSVIYPAKYDSVIAVAATDSNDNRASFSSTGEEVELAAPGVSVYSTWNDGDSPHDPQPVCGTDANNEQGCYKYGSGTSMASPHVAGVAALVIASGVVTDVDGDGHVNDEVRARMNETAEDLGAAGRDVQFGYGLVDADGASSSAEPKTDVAITAVEAPGSVLQGDVVEVSVTVENVGTEDVTSDITVILTDDTDGSDVGTQTISGGLTAGASETLTFSWDTGSATIGDHTLIAAHDFTDDDPSNDSKSTTVTVTEETAGISVTGIDPDTMTVGTTIDVTITGSGFVDGAAVTFENGAGPAPEASNIVISDGTSITAAVTAKSAGPPKDRTWDVRVTNPDGSSAVLEGGFTVTP